MGNTRPTVRTLDSGEKITHHPDGRTVLHPSRAAETMLSASESRIQAAFNEVDQKMVDAVAAKRASLAAGDPVPEDKRSI